MDDPMFYHLFTCLHSRFLTFLFCMVSIEVVMVQLTLPLRCTLNPSRVEGQCLDNEHIG
jgi:hypothetical protein